MSRKEKKRGPPGGGRKPPPARRDGPVQDQGETTGRSWLPRDPSQRQQKIVRQSSLADDSIQLNQEAGVPKPLQYDPIDHPRGIRLLRLAQGGLEEDSKDKDGKDAAVAG